MERPATKLHREFVYLGAIAGHNKSRDEVAEWEAYVARLPKRETSTVWAPVIDRGRPKPLTESEIDHG